MEGAVVVPAEGEVALAKAVMEAAQKKLASAQVANNLFIE